MAWTPYQFFLAGMMVVTGSINTLSTKWTDTMNATDSAGIPKRFDHPYLQACGMFMGEILCLIVYKVYHLIKYYRQRELHDMVPLTDSTRPKFNPLIFLPPALCDMCATSTMYMGLNLTYASSFQMIRGAVIIFTGLLSVLVLRRRLQAYKWVGMVLVMLGLVIVGLSDVLYLDTSDYDRDNIIIGDVLILLAQVITATQMVLEEKFISKYNVPPLVAVGYEGLFGFTVLTVLLFPMYFIYVGPPFSGNPRGVLEDALDGFVQMKNHPLLVVALCGTIISIAFFNFAGVSVTKELSATTRMVLDSVRTIVIWVVSIALKWQDFNGIEVAGFLVLLLGMSLYNDIIIMPFIRKYCMRRTPPEDESTEPIVPVQPDEISPEA